MVKRKVIWTKTAETQLREILSYWKRRNGSAVYSEKILTNTHSRIKVILKYPESYKVTIYPETRISAMGHFSILYKFTKDQLIITAFWDNRQDSERLLDILKKQ
ncbi:MAG: type II toxin-antitoxin system RelE/ParE family toxin [Mucilaginibacter sp.]